jgi:ADP-ribose pyrophosphatase YjhB (NUDIX family)
MIHGSTAAGYWKGEGKWAQSPAGRGEKRRRNIHEARMANLWHDGKNYRPISRSPSAPALLAMKYCSQCGSPVRVGVPPGDNLPRFVCDNCDTIHYQNPKIVAGCIPEWEDRILLCRRAIEPRYGLWTLPAGFMENGETTTQAAARETLEEANARVAVGELFTLYSLPHISQVYMMFRGTMLDLDYQPGSESLEVKLFRESEIPWDELAFPTIRETLKHYFRDREAGTYQFHVGDITPTP